MTIDSQSIIAFLGIVLANVLGFINLRNNLRKSTAEAKNIEAEASERVANTYAKLLSQLQEKVDTEVKHREDLAGRVKELELLEKRLAKEFREVLKGVNVLVTQVIEHGDTPRYTPPVYGDGDGFPYIDF